MNLFDELRKNCCEKEAIDANLDIFLMAGIYSPVVIRAAADNWNSLPFYVTEDTPLPIQEIIHQSSALTDNEIQYRLNKYAIKRAVEVLSQYHDCPVPLTNRSDIPVTRQNLLSEKGEKALAVLRQAVQQKYYTDKMARLAHKTTHKHLMDLSYYVSWRLPAKLLLQEYTFLDENRTVAYNFPTIQLTQGCVNNCSHCMAEAEPKLSHMPYPMFLGLFTCLNKTYKKYPEEIVDGESYAFNRFFSDSDMITYRDNIMGVDSGDVIFQLTFKHERGSAFMTRGVTDRASEIALAKVLMLRLPILLSFVDTPAENMAHNIKQLQRTLQLLEKMGMKEENFPINHLHLKSGPTVSDDVFMGFENQKVEIYKAGRARQFPDSELLLPPDEAFQCPIVLRPSGNVVWQEVKNGVLESQTLTSLFRVGTRHKPTFMRHRAQQSGNRQRVD